MFAKMPLRAKLLLAIRGYSAGGAAQRFPHAMTAHLPQPSHRPPYVASSGFPVRLTDQANDMQPTGFHSFSSLCPRLLNHHQPFSNHRSSPPLALSRIHHSHKQWERALHLMQNVPSCGWINLPLALNRTETRPLSATACDPMAWFHQPSSLCVPTAAAFLAPPPRPRIP